MASDNAVGKVITFVAWLTGVLVSLAVGFGMKDGALQISWVNFLTPQITVIAGWIVIILTIVGVILAIANRE